MSAHGAHPSGQTHRSVTVPTYFSVILVEVMRRFRMLAAVLTALFVSSTMLIGQKAQAASATCAEFTVKLTSVLNPSSEARLLTQWSDEVASAAQWGFTVNEGQAAFAAAPGAGPGLVPVWRTYHRTTHDFTWAAEGADLNAVLAAGYQKELVQFYASTVDNTCTSPVYRAAKGNKTRLVHGTTDRDAAARDGWAISRTAFMAPASKPASSPSPSPSTPPGGPRNDFSIAVIPDTQQEVWSDGDVKMRNRSQWIADNASAQKIAYATHVGDVVDWGAVEPAQFTRAKSGMAPLNDKVPWSSAIGNHDTAAVCVGGSACPGANTSVTVRDTTAFNAAFPASTFTKVAGQFERGKVDNSYHTFQAGGQNWMVLNLELWPRPAAVTWARSVVQSHPRHNVIVNTHSYLNADGSIGKSNGGYGATSPQYLYDNLIKVYPNVVMVLSGHTGSGASRVDTGTNGNEIVSLLQCYHSRTTNPTRMISFDVAAGSITHWVYAPLTNQTMQGKTTVTGLKFTR